MAVVHRRIQQLGAEVTNGFKNSQRGVLINYDKAGETLELKSKSDRVPTTVLNSQFTDIQAQKRLAVEQVGPQNDKMAKSKKSLQLAKKDRPRCKLEPGHSTQIGSQIHLDLLRMESPREIGVTSPPIKSKRNDLHVLLSPTSSKHTFTSPKPSNKPIGFPSRNLNILQAGLHGIHSVPTPPAAPQLGEYIRVGPSNEPSKYKPTKKRSGFKEGIIVAPTLVNMPQTSSPTQSNLHINISVGGPVKKITLAKKKKKVKRNQSSHQSQSNIATSKAGSAAATNFGVPWMNSKRGGPVSSPGSTLRQTEHEERNSLRRDLNKISPTFNQALLQRVLFDAARMNTDSNFQAGKQKSKLSTRIPTQSGWMSPHGERMDTLTSKILTNHTNSGTKRLRSTKSPSARLTLDSSDRGRTTKFGRDVVQGNQFLGLRNSANSPEMVRNKALVKVSGVTASSHSHWKLLSPKANTSHTNRLNESQDGKTGGMLALGSPHSLKKQKKRRKKEAGTGQGPAGASRTKQKLVYEHSAERYAAKTDGKTYKSKDKLKDSFSESSAEDSVYAHSYRLGYPPKQKSVTGPGTQRDQQGVKVLLRHELGGLRNSGDVSRPSNPKQISEEGGKGKKKFHVHLMKKDGLPFVSPSGNSLPLKSSTSSARDLATRRNMAAVTIQRWTREHLLRLNYPENPSRGSKNELPSWMEEANKKKPNHGLQRGPISLPASGLPECRKAYSPNKIEAKGNSLLSEEVEKIINSELRSLGDPENDQDASQSLVRSVNRQTNGWLKKKPYNRSEEPSIEVSYLKHQPPKTNHRSPESDTKRQGAPTGEDAAHPAAYDMPEELINQDYRESDVSERDIQNSAKNRQKSSSRVHSRIVSMKQAERGLQKAPTIKGSVVTNERPKQPAVQPAANKPVVPKIGITEWNKLAKDQYENWGTVTGLIATIEAKMGGRAAEDVQQLFKKLEVFAEMSKKSLKEALIGYDPGLSNQPSDTRSHRQDSILKGSSLFERKGSSLVYSGPERVSSIRADAAGSGGAADVVSREHSQSIDAESRHRLSSKRSSKAVLERWIEPSQVGRGSPSMK